MFGILSDDSVYSSSTGIKMSKNSIHIYLDNYLIRAGYT